MSKPTLDQVINTAKTVTDLIDAGESIVGKLETVGGVSYRLKVQRRKLANAKPIMRPWHAWRVSVLEGKLREALGLPFNAKLPE